jgi:hypothetical protein
MRFGRNNVRPRGLIKQQATDDCPHLVHREAVIQTMKAVRGETQQAKIQSMGPVLIGAKNGVVEIKHNLSFLNFIYHDRVIIIELANVTSCLAMIRAREGQLRHLIFISPRS